MTSSSSSSSSIRTSSSTATKQTPIERCLYGEYSYATILQQESPEENLLGNPPHNTNLVSDRDAIGNDADETLRGDRQNERMGDVDATAVENHGGGVAKLANKFEYLQVDDVSIQSKSNTHKLRVTNLDHTIDLVELRRLAAMSGGISDVGSHRAVAWRVLLGYLPPQLRLWEETLRKERNLYRLLLQELFLPNPIMSGNSTTSDTGNSQSFHNSIDKDDDRARVDDIPEELRLELKLSGRETLLEINNDPDLNCLNIQNADSFIDDATLLDEIRKDVIRTHPALSFYLEPMANLGKRRYAALERILFVWSKLNKGVRYVQGMNEIIGTIFFVLATDENREWSCEAEADAYNLFNIIMIDMRDVFMSEMDDADTGIQGRIHNMMQLLSLHDPLLRCHLLEVGIDPTYYAIRWLTTLLSREFPLPETIRVWDSMFASTHRENFLRYLCVSMLIALREKLAVSDFGECLRCLQSYPLSSLPSISPIFRNYTSSVDALLESARALWIYESQITIACHRGNVGMDEALMSVKPPRGIFMAYGLQGGVYKQNKAGTGLPFNSPLNKKRPDESRSQQRRAQLQQVQRQANKMMDNAQNYGRSLFGGASKLMSEWEVKLRDVQEQVRLAEVKRQEENVEKNFHQAATLSETSNRVQYGNVKVFVKNSPSACNHHIQS